MERTQLFVRTNREGLSYRPISSPNHHVEASTVATTTNQYFGTEPVLPLSGRSYRTYSTVSSSSTNSDFDTFSHRSSVSTSSISSADARQQMPAPLFDQACGFNLPCEFLYLECEIDFHPEDFEAWISHCQSHFQRVGPPSYAICTFCDGEEGQFRAQDDLGANWRNRMMHIKGHLERFDWPRRPDFHVVEHLWNNGLLSLEDYKSVVIYSERPPCEGILPADHILREKKARLRRQQEKDMQEPHNLRREQREMKERDNKRKSKGKDTY